MTRLSVRLTLLLACVAAIGYAAFLTWSTERQVRLADDSSRQFTTTARAASVGVAELRAAQQAYVAVGQGAGLLVRARRRRSSRIFPTSSRS